MSRADLHSMHDPLLNLTKKFRAAKNDREITPIAAGRGSQLARNFRITRQYGSQGINVRTICSFSLFPPSS